MSMTERQRLIIYACLNYCQCNVDDLNQAFETENYDGFITINGNVEPAFTSEEFTDLLHDFSKSLE